jgi:type II secretory pathway predicted ATPase ExeA
MPPPNPTETVEYIERHREIAGASKPIFSQEAFSTFYEVTFGIPRCIGVAVEMSLTLFMLEGKKSVDTDLVPKAKSTS